MANRIDPRMISGLTRNLPGARPMPAPLSNPSGNNPATAPTRFTSSATMTDGNRHVLANMRFDSPRNVDVMLFAPFDAQSPNFVGGVILGDQAAAVGPPATPLELWILGEVDIGQGGCVETFSFDIPVGQMVRFSVVAESVQVRCRLIQMPALGLIAYDFQNPPIYGGKTIPIDDVPGSGNAPSPAQCFCIAGEGAGSAGFSNLSRRWQLSVGAGATTGLLVPPKGATMWRVLSDPHMICEPTIAVASGVGPAFVTTEAMGNLPSDAQDRIVPTNLLGIKLNNTDVVPWGAELVYRIGLSGFPC